MAEIDPAPSQEELESAVPPGPDLSNAVLGDGSELTPQGSHANGTLCFHGIDPSPEGQAAFRAPERPQGAGKWLLCRDGQYVLTESYSAAEGSPGWFLVPTPCPECGEAGSVEVRRMPIALDSSPLEEQPYEFRCTTCGATGPAAPKPGSQAPVTPA